MSVYANKSRPLIRAGWSDKKGRRNYGRKKEKAWDENKKVLRIRSYIELQRPVGWELEMTVAEYGGGGYEELEEEEWMMSFLAEKRP